MLMLLPMLGVWILFMVMLWAHRGDGRSDLKRCQKCWYSMDGAADLTCPECGFRVRIEKELYQPRRHTRVFRAAGVAMGVLVAGWIWVAIPAPWTQKVPRFALRLAVRMAEPYRGIPRTPIELAATTPDSRLRDSRDAWQRALWQQQVNNCVRQWAEAALEKTGPITPEELVKLVPLAELAHESYVQTGGISYDEGWLSELEKDSIARMRANTTSLDLKLRAEWVLGELQYEGGDYSHRFDWGVVPPDVLAMALAHADPEVRLFGVDRVGAAANRALVTKGKIPFPPLSDIVQKIAATDPDRSVRSRAKDVVSYMEAFKIK